MSDTLAAPADATTTPFVHTIRVGWGDCDPAKIAFTGRIPVFALDAIDAWWGATMGADWFALNLDQNIGTPFVHLEVDFRSPVTPRAPLECEVRLTKVGNRSIGFAVRGVQAGTLCFEGNFVCVFVVADEFQPIPVPEQFRDRLDALLAG